MTIIGITFFYIGSTPIIDFYLNFSNSTHEKSNEEITWADRFYHALSWLGIILGLIGMMGMEHEVRTTNKKSKQV